MKKRIFFLLLLLVGLRLGAQAADIKIVNTGEMNVKGAMYVGGDMQMKDASADKRVVSVIHNGTTALAGSFYQDASGHVFKTENNDWANKSKPRGVTTSEGTIKFVSSTGKTRYISSSDTINFNRVANYISFPNLLLSTDDRVYVPSTLGLDARTIKQATNNDGVLYLASNPVGDFVYDASLRVTGDDGDYSVDADAVIVEKRVREFRQTSSGGAATILMPFASPIVGLRSGYFAGNWVRSPQIGADNSYFYPYANKNEVSGGELIDSDQYVINPRQALVVTKPYLLRLQKPGSTEGSEYADLIVTTDATHDKDKFIFNGKPYASLETVTGKQLFAGSANPISFTFQAGKAKTQNWVVGNSYTSALNGQAIAEHLMHDASCYYVENMYIYHHGATGYETYSIWDGNDVPQNIPDIQGMSVFMIAASANNPDSETITIGPEYQVHSAGMAATAPKPGNPVLKASSAEVNELRLFITPEDNPFVYDRTTIKLSGEALSESDKQDVGKLLNPGNRLFQIYGKNGSGAYLQCNALPYNAEKAEVSVSPAAEEMACVLSAENANDFSSEALQLYDRKLNQWHDLKLDSSYRFVLSPADEADRFELYFSPRKDTGWDSDLAGNWSVFNSGDELIVQGLNASMIGKPIQIYSITGTSIVNESVKSVPQQGISTASFPAGIYLFALDGKTIKFIKQQ